MSRLPRIPDLLTSANLACGVGAILWAATGNLIGACWLVLLAALFDVLDGMVARLTGGGTALGEQLDSLADMVSFGTAPAVIMFFQASSTPTIDATMTWALPMACLILVIASAWRLAIFNITTHKNGDFLGLPTPANALWWISLSALAANDTPIGPYNVQADLLEHPYLLLILCVIFGALMLSRSPFPSLKFTSRGWKGNEIRVLLILFALVACAFFGTAGIPLTLLLYLASPIWGRPFAT